jgi:murein L,D-transpeptidase YcbB/YkuD
VPDLRARLVRTGDVATPSTEGLLYDAALEEGVRRFQARHGLEPDGVVGPATLRALNVPVGDRIDQIRVNLDRARWVLHQVGGRQVVVDIAGFEVYVLENGQVVWRSRAQVGRSYRQTPVFRDDIRYLVVNPDWTVPRGILGKDILPRIQKDPGYLAAQNMRVLTPGGEEVDPASVSWSRYTGANFPYVLRQDPGPNNALGRIKIMFPNRHAVYLHDTPARSLYDRTERTFSSGCIRVEDAFELGAILLDDPDAWTRDRLEAAATGTQPRTLNLPSPWPVLLLYWTVSVGEDGTVSFRPDIYDRDPPVLKRLREPFAP